MRHTLLLLSLLTIGACATPPPPATDAASIPMTTLAYPAARTVDQVDDYHGVKVADPYRWLEELDAPDTRAWIDAQNALTQKYLGEVAQRPRSPSSR